MSKHFGERIIEDVLAMREQGYTLQKIADELGYDYIQIKALLYRYGAKQRNSSTPKAKGRPRTQGLTEEQKKDLKIKKLEMEVDLLRSFLQAAGRM